MPIKVVRTVPEKFTADGRMEVAQHGRPGRRRPQDEARDINMSLMQD